MRNLDPAITSIVNPVGKPLPFKSKNGKFTMLNNETKSSNIVSWMKGQVKAGKKILVVDDFQYLLSIPYMNRIHEGGWDKWNDFGDDYFRLIDVCAELPADVRVYYLPIFSLFSASTCARVFLVLPVVPVLPDVPAVLLCVFITCPTVKRWTMGSLPLS